jgi:hypothetical protein
MLTIMELEKLDKFSSLMYKLLSSSFPQWIVLAKNIPDHDEAFMIEVPSPHDDQCKLRIYTDNEEITVGFDYSHSHFGWIDIPDTEAFTKAKEYIDSILRDGWLVASEIREGKWHRSYSFRADYLDEVKSKNPNFNRIVGWNKMYFPKDDSPNNSLTI